MMLTSQLINHSYMLAISNQACAPHYKLVITELGGEQRLVSAIAERMSMLGAVLNADRRATANARY